MAAEQPARKKSALKSPVTWIIVLGIAVAGGAYILYKRSQSSSTTTATGTGTGGTGTGTGTGTGVDYSGQISTLQTEIENLQSSAGQDTGQDKTGSTPPPPPPAKKPAPAPVKKSVIPNVIGLTVPQARSELAAGHMQLGHVTGSSAAGYYIVSQFPAGGNTASYGTKVNVHAVKTSAAKAKQLRAAAAHSKVA